MPFNKAKALQEAERSVTHGKLSQAIRQYLEIAENDPGDLALLNTVGDLCVRDRNIPEALRLFRKLADAYAREGFTLKSIAIYRKIAKLDPEAVDSLVKLAELYLKQGLTREALKLYAEALEFCKSRNLNEKALEVMRQIVAADPENQAHRARLAECCEAMGRKEEAARVYLETAEAALHRGDRDTASALLGKAAMLSPANAGLESLRARLAPEQPPALPDLPGPAIEPESAAMAEQPPVSPESVTVEAPPEAGSLLPAGDDRDDSTGARIISPFSAVAAGPEMAQADPLQPPAEEIQPAFEASGPLQGSALDPTDSPGDTGGVQAPATEFDLSGEWESLTTSGSEVAGLESPVFDYEESSTEIDFYLSTGLTDEARRALRLLEEKSPGDTRLAGLRRRVDEHGVAPPTEEPEIVETEPAASEPLPALPRFAAPEPRGGEDEDLIQSLTEDLEMHWPGLDRSQLPPHPTEMANSGSPDAAKDFTASLGALLEELGEETGQSAPHEDPGTHYDLGVAFREMGLLEEAIGEFQKVIKTAHAGTGSPQFLPACTLLGVCFMDQNMPALAAKWYLRALESRDLDEETRLALDYDLGTAYERAGEFEFALQRFLEVYSQNVDYRDVAERIRLLKKKPS